MDLDKYFHFSLCSWVYCQKRLCFLLCLSEYFRAHPFLHLSHKAGYWEKVLHQRVVDMAQDPQDISQSTELPEFKEHLNNALSHWVWFLGRPAWGQRLDSVVLWAPYKLEHSVILRGASLVGRSQPSLVSTTAGCPFTGEMSLLFTRNVKAKQ